MNVYGRAITYVYFSNGNTIECSGLYLQPEALMPVKDYLILERGGPLDKLDNKKNPSKCCTFYLNQSGKWKCLQFASCISSISIKLTLGIYQLKEITSGSLNLFQSAVLQHK